MAIRKIMESRQTTKSLTRRSECCARLILLVCLALAGAFPAEAFANRYKPLGEIAEFFGLEERWIQQGEELELSSKWSVLRFRVHKRDFTLNSHRVFLGSPVAINRGSLMITERDFDSTLKPLLAPQTTPNTPKLYHIVIDPGHGGDDPGANNDHLGVNEKDNTLDLAKRLKQRLEPFGYKVTLTRDSDRFISLSERPAIANRHNADLFISIHFNAFGTPSVSGLETFTMTPVGDPSSNSSRITAGARKSYPGNGENTWSTLAGYYIHTSLTSKLGPVTDRGLKRARFIVLREAECPAVLIEGGFVTNPDEARKIKSPEYRQKMAEAITAGILRYQRTLDRLRGR